MLIWRLLPVALFTSGDGPPISSSSSIPTPITAPVRAYLIMC